MKEDHVKSLQTEILSDDYYTLKKVTFDYKTSHGQWQTQIREAYDRGNGAAIFLYNPDNNKVILTKQFRLPTYINGNADGMMIEVCAGMLDEQNPVDCIIKEVKEETGYNISEVTKIFESYMTPGAVTELLHFFAGRYTPDMKALSGGGVVEEQEDIQVLELNFSEAYDMIASGLIKDAKTIMLLQYARIEGLVKYEN